MQFPVPYCVLLLGFPWYIPQDTSREGFRLYHYLHEIDVLRASSFSLLHEVPEGKGHGAKKIETFKKGIF